MFDVQAISESGGHQVNEDAYLVLQHPDDSSCWICCLGDGQGGRVGGAKAAQLACQIAMNLACQMNVNTLKSRTAWRSILEVTDRVVQKDNESGFTTLIAFIICPGQIIGAACGDSAVIHIHSSGSNLLTERQQKNPPVGSGNADFTPFVSSLQDTDKVLAVTDGVWKYCGWSGLIATAKVTTGLELLDQLLAQARLPRTGQLQDDFTAIVFNGKSR